MPSADPSRRDRLVAAAIELFSRYGVRRTSVDDIAAEAGIAKGSVYLELAGKDALFRAAAEHVAAQIVADARAAAAAEGALEKRVVDVLVAKFWRMYDLVHSRPHGRELIDAKDAVAADVFRAADDRYAAILERVLATARWRVSPAELASVLLRGAHGAGYGATRLSAAAYRKRVATMVDLVLAGARPGRRARGVTSISTSTSRTQPTAATSKASTTT